MNRTRFLHNFLNLGIFSILGFQTDGNKIILDGSKVELPIRKDQKPGEQLRQELIASWFRSETMTMTNVKQMPPEFFTFKYTNEAMTFSEQWRHCIIYTCGQLAGRTGIQNPFENVKLPVQMPKERIIEELKKMYNFIRKSIEELSEEKLLSNCDFAGDSIPIWRLFYALENHIIHHRGQCVVYLRLNGVVPKGFYGW